MQGDFKARAPSSYSGDRAAEGGVGGSVRVAEAQETSSQGEGWRSSCPQYMDKVLPTVVSHSGQEKQKKGTPRDEERTSGRAAEEERAEEH